MARYDGRQHGCESNIVHRGLIETGMSFMKNIMSTIVLTMALLASSLTSVSYAAVTGAPESIDEFCGQVIDPIDNDVHEASQEDGFYLIAPDFYTTLDSGTSWASNVKDSWDFAKIVWVSWTDIDDIFEQVDSLKHRPEYSSWGSILGNMIHITTSHDNGERAYQIRNPAWRRCYQADAAAWQLFTAPTSPIARFSSMGPYNDANNPTHLIAVDEGDRDTIGSKKSAYLSYRTEAMVNFAGQPLIYGQYYKFDARVTEIGMLGRKVSSNPARIGLQFRANPFSNAKAYSRIDFNLFGYKILKMEVKNKAGETEEKKVDYIETYHGQGEDSYDREIWSSVDRSGKEKYVNYTQKTVGTNILVLGVPLHLRAGSEVYGGPVGRMILDVDDSVEVAAETGLIVNAGVMARADMTAKVARAGLSGHLDLWKVSHKVKAEANIPIGLQSPEVRISAPISQSMLSGSIWFKSEVLLPKICKKKIRIFGRKVKIPYPCGWRWKSVYNKKLYHWKPLSTVEGHVFRPRTYRCSQLSPLECGWSRQ